MSRLVVLFALFAAVGCTRESEVAPAQAPPRVGGATQSAEPQVTQSSGPQLKPVDEGANDPSFVAFRNELLDAVRQRDVARLVKGIDPKIRTSFGGGGGIEQFRKELTDEKWRELEFILSHGGKFLKNAPTPSFWAPYVYSAWPDDIDAFSYGAVTGDNVNLVDAEGKTIAALSYNIVKIAPMKTPTDEWRDVETADGLKGRVKSSEIRSPIGYRAGFVKNGGEWKMNALVAGD